MVAQGNGATRSAHLTLGSPAVLLKNALGFALAARSIPATHEIDLDQPCGYRSRLARPGGLGISPRARR